MTKPKENQMLDHIINWKLEKGSHPFPGPDGGTCINEAAIVAAGFEYRAISSAKDCPPCFSRVIGQYAIGLNDRMPDTARNELLLPFVMRLAGTADTDEVERARVHHIAIRGVNLVLPIVMRVAKRENLALMCEGVKTLSGARETAARARDVLRAYAAAAAYATAAADAAATADAAAAAAADAYAARRQVWLAAVQILDEAIKLGNQGDALAVETAVERLNAARAKVSV